MYDSSSVPVIRAEDLKAVDPRLIGASPAMLAAVAANRARHAEKKAATARSRSAMEAEVEATLARWDAEAALPPQGDDFARVVMP